MELNASTVISLLATLCTLILGYLLREKDSELKALKSDIASVKSGSESACTALGNRIGTLETKNEVHAEANKHRDERSERIETKLDRLLDKLGA